jgi:hypothetical protein
MKGGLVFLAIDLELSGCQLAKDNIVAIGWSALLAITGETVHQGCISMQHILGRRPFEPRCKAEFWSKHEALLTTLQVSSVAPHLGTARFFEVLDELDRDYELRIVTDNPCSDIAWLDLYASIFLDRKPMCYKHNLDNGWRPVYDTDSYARAAARIPYREAYTNNADVMHVLGIDSRQVPPATHHPTEDARSIAVLHRLVYLTEPRPPPQ